MLKNFKISRSAAIDGEIVEWLFNVAEDEGKTWSSVVNEKLREAYERENENN